MAAGLKEREHNGGVRAAQHALWARRVVAFRLALCCVLAFPVSDQHLTLFKCNSVAESLSRSGRLRNPFQCPCCCWLTR